MKILLNVELDGLDDLDEALAMLAGAMLKGAKMTAATPQEVAVAVRAAEAKLKDIEAAQKPKQQPKPTEQEQPPAATAPVAPPAHAEPSPQPAVAGEPAVAAAPVEAKKLRGRPKKAEAATVPPPAAVAAAAAQPTAGAKPTSSNGGSIDDLRKRLMQTFADYVQRYGTNFGYTDVSKMLTDTFGPGVRKSSDVTDDNLAKAVAVVGQAIEANPFGRRRADVN